MYIKLHSSLWAHATFSVVKFLILKIFIFISYLELFKFLFIFILF